MPKISDVIVQGADVLHFFDTPILLTREYPLNFEQRCIKRFIDLFCAIILIVLTSPIMLITAFLIKVTDGGPVFYKQVRLTINNKRFENQTPARGFRGETSVFRGEFTLAFTTTPKS